MGAGQGLSMRWPARLLLAGCGALFLQAYLAGSALPAAIGLGGILYLLHTHHVARERFAAVRVKAERHVAESLVHEHSPCTVVLETTGSHIPFGVRARFHDVLSADLVADAAQQRLIEGPARSQYRMTPTARGEAAIRALHVHLVDERRQWSQTRLHRLDTFLQVHPPKEALEVGRRLAKRTPFDATSPHPLALLVRDFEYETSRPFQSGDRLRDVDWKRVSAGRGLMSKQWEKEQQAMVVLLIDAGRTMRSRLPGAPQSNLDHAVSLALQMVEVAAQKNFPVGIVLFDDVHVLEEMPPSRDRLLTQRLSRAVANLPHRIRAARRLDAGLPSDAEVPEGDLGFLGALAGWRNPQHRQTAARGVEHAMQRALVRGRGSRLLIVAFTDLEAVPGATLGSIVRSATEGHRTVAALMPSSRSEEEPAPPTLRDLENAYRRRVSRERGLHRLRAAGVQAIELDPLDTAAQVLATTQDKGRRRGVGR